MTCYFHLFSSVPCAAGHCQQQYLLPLSHPVPWKHDGCSTYPSLKSLGSRRAGVAIKGWVPWWENQNPKKKPPNTPTGAEESITRARLHFLDDALLERASISTCFLHLGRWAEPEWELGIACPCSTQLQKDVRAKSSKTKSISRQHQPLSLCHTFACSFPQLIFPSQQGRNQRGNSASQFPNRCSTRNSPMNRNSCSSASSSLSRVCEECSPCRQTERKRPLGSGCPVLIPLLPASTRGRKQQSFSRFASACFGWLRGGKASEVNWHSLKGNPTTPHPAWPRLQCLFPNPMSSAVLSWDASPRLQLLWTPTLSAQV